MKRTPGNRRFDVVFYAPWGANLVGVSSAEVAAGGGETQLFLLAKGLAARGLRAGMVVMGRSDELPAAVDGVALLPQARRRSTRGPMARAALGVGALRTMVAARASVLVQRNAGATTAAAALAARITGARFVYSSASVMDFDLASFEPSRLNTALFEWGLGRADLVVVQTDEQARLCRERFGRDSLVIKSVGVPPRPRGGSPEAFLWVGKLQPVKRPAPYLDLARALPEATFRMIAVPDASESPELRRLVTEAAEKLPNLELLAPRSRDGVGDLLDRTVAVVNTSVREGMPNVCLEGWSRGVPTLALSFDPGGVVAAEGLGAVADGDPSRLVEETRGLWRCRDEPSELAQRCMDYIRREHSEETVIEQWIAQVLPASLREGASTS